MLALRRVILGKFISFEGPEGAGKSTQILRLAAFLKAQGQSCLVTKEPGGTPIGRHIRKILLHRDHEEMIPVCEALLYLADRAQHVSQVIRPALQTGRWVITDRYHDSTRAYQGAARGLEAAQLENLGHLATQGLEPDVTILLDLPVEVGLTRAQARNSTNRQEQTEGRFEAEDLDFHRRVRAFFLELVATEPDRFMLINANQPVNEVAAAILKQFQLRWAFQHV